MGWILGSIPSTTIKKKKKENHNCHLFGKHYLTLFIANSEPSSMQTCHFPNPNPKGP
jgi:hypothetical protein